MAYRTHAIAESDKCTTQDAWVSGSRRPTTAGSPRGRDEPLACGACPCPGLREEAPQAPRDDIPEAFEVLSLLLDNLQTALPGLNSSKASQKSALWQFA